MSGAPGARGIHHVGIAVHDVAAATSLYELLTRGSVLHEATVPEQGVHAVALQVGTGPFVELLEPTGADTPVGRFLAKRGEGMHHVAYEVADVGSELERLRAAGLTLIDEAPRPGLFGLQVAFVHPDSVRGVLCELVQPLVASGAAEG